MCTNIYGQTKENKINFIIFIDDELSNLNISNGHFITIDSTNNENKLDFDYIVGDLKVTQEDYNTLYSSENYKLYICFKYKEFNPEYYEKEYKYQIPVEWLNDKYMILKIYNSSKKRNKKYYFGDKDYLVQFSIPGKSSILPLKK